MLFLRAPGGKQLQHVQVAEISELVRCAEEDGAVQKRSQHRTWTKSYPLPPDVSQELNVVRVSVSFLTSGQNMDNSSFWDINKSFFFNGRRFGWDRFRQETDLFVNFKV